MSNNYKNSLIMPRTTLDMKANLNKKEPELQKQWIKNNIYQKRIDELSSKEQFILHDGPPYANGDLHVGHALNKILKDFIIRNKTLKNLYAPMIFGWDTHGLPIENVVSKDETYESLSIVNKREMCKNYALSQVDNQKEQFKRLGLFTNYEKKYLTLDKTYEMDQLEIFNIMVKKNYIYQDFKPIHWSPSTVSALADAEIEYKDVSSPSIYVAFETLDNKVLAVKTKLIIWTTTPWTIPSNLAIAVNKDFDYINFKYENNNYLVAKNLYEKITNILEWKNTKIIKTVNGFDLNKIQYKHPIYDRVSPIILADYVLDTDGTGLVHNAPGFGVEDYYACKENNIDVFCPIDEKGFFTKDVNDKDLENFFYQDANKIVGEKLRTNNALLHFKFIKHSTAHDWRSKQPLIFRATKQWFINIQVIHDNIEKILSNDVKSVNPQYIERIKEMVLNRKEWCISRQRVWGLPITIIFDENNKPIYDNELSDNILKILSDQGVNTWFEKPVEYFLTKKYLKTKKQYSKEKDIMDVWFDSGTSYSILKRNNLKFPADLYLEGSDQFRGWFNSSLITSTIVNNKSPYNALLKHGFVLDEKGFKMSKSLKNVINPLDICNEYGADILRMWVGNSDYSDDLKIGKTILIQTSELYRKIRNTLFRYPLSNLNDFNIFDKKELSLVNRYIINRLNTLIKRVSKAYDDYKFNEVIKLMNNFTIELSQWYFDLIKDSLYCDIEESNERNEIKIVLFHILKTSLILLTPIIPHTTEEVYANFEFKNKKEAIMFETWPALIENKIDSKEIELLENFFKIKDNIYVELEKARKENIIKKNNEAKVIINFETDIDLKDLKKWLNIAHISIDMKLKNIHIENANFKKCLRCWNHIEDNSMFNEEICIRCNDCIK